AAKESLAIWSGLVPLDGDRYSPCGTFPAGAAALLNLEEVVVHNWDVAKATGQALTIDPNVADMVYEFCLSIPLDPYRAHGAFGPEIAVPESASVTDRILGLLGRQP